VLPALLSGPLTGRRSGPETCPYQFALSLLRNAFRAAKFHRSARRQLEGHIDRGIRSCRLAIPLLKEGLAVLAGLPLVHARAHFFAITVVP
jgi:hypothetical protein